MIMVLVYFILVGSLHTSKKKKVKHTEQLKEHSEYIILHLESTIISILLYLF